MSYSVDVDSVLSTASCAHFVYSDSFKEMLHGHNYRVRVKVRGNRDRDGFVVNFLTLKAAISELTHSLDHRVLVAGANKLLKVSHLESEEGQPHIEVVCSMGERYVMPEKAVAVLPVENTTAEELAAYFAERVSQKIAADGRLTSIEVTVWETEHYSATYVRNLP
ncbi:MAG: 6-carboxytetrahydropterin synthase [Thermoprotei archaeon]